MHLDDSEEVLRFCCN